MAAEKTPARRRVVLTGISSRAWEHPADKGALAALRELRGFDDVLKSISGIWDDRAWRMMFLGGSIRADHRQHPRVHRLFAEAAASLDVAELPELYVQLSPQINAQCVGISGPFIVVTSAAVDAMDDDELRYVLGHELGHLLSGHAIYRTMMTILANLAVNLAWLPIGAMALRAIIAALSEWWRKAELSADRAGLLAGQDPSAALRAHMKLAGGGDLSEVDTAAFLEQAAEYESAGDLRESFIKLRLTVNLTHPLPVARAADLRRWVDAGAYARILGGDYPRRDADRDASLSGAAREAADSYRESFRRSQDPLVSLMRKLSDGTTGMGDMVGAGARSVRDWMGRAAGRGSRPDGNGESSTKSGTDD